MCGLCNLVPPVNNLIEDITQGFFILPYLCNQASSSTAPKWTITFLFRKLKSDLKLVESNICTSLCSIVKSTFFWKYSLVSQVA